MQGLVDFAGEIGNAMAILLPTFCYLMALASFLFAAWGFWMMAHPGKPLPREAVDSLRVAGSLRRICVFR